MTQEVLAASLGISVATVNRIERSKFVPRDQVVSRFAELEKLYKDGEEIQRSLAGVPADAGEI